VFRKGPCLSRVSTITKKRKKKQKEREKKKGKLEKRWCHVIHSSSITLHIGLRLLSPAIDRGGEKKRKEGGKGGGGEKTTTSTKFDADPWIFSPSSEAERKKREENILGCPSSSGAGAGGGDYHEVCHVQRKREGKACWP